MGMGSKNVVAPTPNSAPHRLGNKSGNNRSGSIPTMPMWRKKSVPIIENEAENDLRSQQIDFSREEGQITKSQQ